jgi:hypothetical protein
VLFHRLSFVGLAPTGYRGAQCVLASLSGRKRHVWATGTAAAVSFTLSSQQLAFLWAVGVQRSGVPVGALAGLLALALAAGAAPLPEGISATKGAPRPVAVHCLSRPGRRSTCLSADQQHGAVLE